MKFFKFNKNKATGFTLIEVLVVVFIIGLLSSILIVNWRNNEKQYQLQMIVQETVQNIRKTQEMALAGSKYFDVVTSTYKIPNSYGVYFAISTPNSYKIFADVNDNKTYDSGNDTIVGGADNQIESGYEISSLVGVPGGTLSGVSVTFNLPDGFTSIRKDGTGTPWQNPLTITIRKIGTTCPSKTCKNIVVSTTGQINIQ
jgi:prepilin-type N-terminal cleavage/methylation domain-containing protein